MASAKELVAMQTFLRGIQALTTYDATRQKQFAQLQKIMSRMSCLSAQQAALWLGTLEESLWSTSQVETIKETLAEKTREEPGEAGKQILQDYTALPYHVSEDLWGLVEGCGERDCVLRKLCMHAGDMGLRYGSEATKATLVRSHTGRGYVRASRPRSNMTYMSVRKSR